MDRSDALGCGTMGLFTVGFPFGLALVIAGLAEGPWPWAAAGLALILFAPALDSCLRWREGKKGRELFFWFDHQEEDQ